LSFNIILGIIEITIVIIIRITTPTRHLLMLMGIVLKPNSIKTDTKIMNKTMENHQAIRILLNSNWQITNILTITTATGMDSRVMDKMILIIWLMQAASSPSRSQEEIIITNPLPIQIKKVKF